MASREQARLGAELEYYATYKSQWLNQHAGKYVVIKDTVVLDFYSSFESAYRAGVSAWGTDTDFLVKKIVEHEPVFFVF